MTRCVIADEGARQEMARLLQQCGLSDAGILSAGSRYWLARRDEALVGTCGVEMGGRFALLRSVCVRPDVRRDGIARRLIAQTLEFLQGQCCESVYLFSKDTGTYFERLGWKPITVQEVREQLPSVPQVRHYDDVGWYTDERAFRLDAASGAF